MLVGRGAAWPAPAPETATVDTVLTGNMSQKPFIPLLSIPHPFVHIETVFCHVKLFRPRDRKRSSNYKEKNRKRRNKERRRKSRRKSYSPMRKRRRDSPSHLEARRITR